MHPAGSACDSHEPISLHSIYDVDIFKYFYITVGRRSCPWEC